MTVPCEQKEAINTIKDSVDEIKNTFQTMYHNGNKLEDALVRLAQCHERQSNEIREMTQTITAHMLDNREFRLNLERGKEERDLLFTKVRHLEESDVHLTALQQNHNVDAAKIRAQIFGKLEALKDVPEQLRDFAEFKNKAIGALIVVPVACTIITTGIGLFVFLGGS